MANIKLRQELERKITKAFVKSALAAAGYRLSVSLERGYDHEEMLLGSRDQKKIVDAVMDGDEAHIFVHEAEGDLIVEDSVNCIGWVLFVMGNDGWDVISDYTTNLEPLMAEADKISKQYE